MPIAKRLPKSILNPYLQLALCLQVGGGVGTTQLRQPNRWVGGQLPLDIPRYKYRCRYSYSFRYRCVYTVYIYSYRYRLMYISYSFHIAFATKNKRRTCHIPSHSIISTPAKAVHPRSLVRSEVPA